MEGRKNGMERTRWIFIVILVVVFLIIGVSVAVRLLTGGNDPTDTGLVLERPETITVRIVTALPVEPWVRLSLIHI